MKPALFIVSVYRPDLYDAALKAVGCASDIEVVLDRRVGERRGPDRRPGEDAGQRERRRMAIAEQLQTSGWALVAPEAREQSEAD